MARLADKIPLCCNCGAVIYWNLPQRIWRHRRGGVNCYPYRSHRAEPTVFREAGGGEL